MLLVDNRCENSINSRINIHFPSSLLVPGVWAIIVLVRWTLCAEIKSQNGPAPETKMLTMAYDPSNGSHGMDVKNIARGMSSPGGSHGRLKFDQKHYCH